MCTRLYGLSSLAHQEFSIAPIDSKKTIENNILDGLADVNLSLSFIFPGSQNVGVRGLHLRHAVGPLPRPPRVQQLRHHERPEAVPRPLVPNVRQDLHLHELVRKTRQGRASRSLTNN